MMHAVQRVRSVAATTAIWLAASAGALAAQDSIYRAPPGRPPEPDASSPVFGGIGLGAMGFAAGAYVGAGQGRLGCGRYDDDDYCGLEGAFFGAAIGGTLGLAAGIHIGNRSRGNFLADFGTAAAVWGGGMVIGTALHWQGEAPLLILTGIPIAQLALTTSIERKEGRKRDRAMNAAVRIIPTSGGGILAISAPLPAIH